MYSSLLRIGGRRIFPLPSLTTVQCDGSFSRVGKGAAAYMVFDAQQNTLLGKKVDLLAVQSSTEAEWASVFHGLQAAITLEQECIGLENDCLSVVAALAHPLNPLKHVYARAYRKKILDLAADTYWTGIRWIPRKLNRADGLFRLK